MTYFATVAAVRIQSWLARTPELRYVRGASQALIELTSREINQLTRNVILTEEAGLPTTVESDYDSSDVDGVCILRSDDVDDLDVGVERLLDHLQRQLPGIEWDAWRAKASSYVEAYDGVQGSGAGASEIRRWPHRLPMMLDLPFAAPCARCAFELATTEVRLPGGDESSPKYEGIGPDCATRWNAGANFEFQDFDQLGKRGKHCETVGRDKSTNHLATICADGNLIGDFFAAVAKVHNSDLQATLSKAVDNAIRTAAQEAAVCGPGGLQVAINHFVGGDDVFASVAAPFAWRYVEILGRRFAEVFLNEVEAAFASYPAEMTTTNQALAVRDAADKVSLGVGVAFANVSHPIGDCRETAQATETYAKRAVRGRAGAVSWLDITVEPSVGQGGAVVPAGRFVTIDQLTTDFQSPPYPFLMDSSARNRLITILRPAPGDTAQDSARAARVWAKRVGRFDELQSFLPEEKASEQECQERVTVLRHTLDRARWWPKPVKTESEEQE